MLDSGPADRYIDAGGHNASHIDTDTGEEIVKMPKLDNDSECFVRPPALSGYSFSYDDVLQMRSDGDLLRAIRIDTNPQCNLKCLYCYSPHSRGAQSPAPLEKLQSLIHGSCLSHCLA